MIPGATATQIGGVKLAGALTGSADVPTICNAYVTPAMLSQAYATAAALATETARAEAAEASLMAANTANYQTAIAYANNSFTQEAQARAQMDATLQSEINSLKCGSLPMVRTRGLIPVQHRVVVLSI
jgi:hypothetical protein